MRRKGLRNFPSGKNFDLHFEEKVGVFQVDLIGNSKLHMLSYGAMNMYAEPQAVCVKRKYVGKNRWKQDK